MQLYSSERGFAFDCSCSATVFIFSSEREYSDLAFFIKMSEPRAKYSKQDVGAIYRSYLMREGPQNVGTVDWPKPKPGTLEGLKFLSTGEYH